MEEGKTECFYCGLAYRDLFFEDKNVNACKMCWQGIVGAYKKDGKWIDNRILKCKNCDNPVRNFYKDGLCLNCRNPEEENSEKLLQPVTVVNLDKLQQHEEVVTTKTEADQNGL